MANYPEFVRIHRGITLVKPGDEKAELVAEVLGKALGKSNYVARSGILSDYYFDLDKIYTDPDPTLKDKIRGFHEVIVTQVQRVIDETKATHIGLISHNDGPRGVVQLRGILAERLTKPTLVIRVDERLVRNQISFGQLDSSKPLLGPQSKVLLFATAATSGASIYAAALIVRKFHAECSDAIVLLDREQGADEKLSIKNIRLASIINKKFLENFGYLPKDDTPKRETPRSGFESVFATV